MQPPWNQRYEEDGYAYGTQPNDFLREQAHRLQGPVLSLAEGEGRNGVFLAGIGSGGDWDRQFRRRLAEGPGACPCPRRLPRDRGGRPRSPRPRPALAMAPWWPSTRIFPREFRRGLHARVREALRPGGLHLLEAYTPAQTERPTGGPRILISASRWTPCAKTFRTSRC
jgi:hypothetical protein